MDLFVRVTENHLRSTITSSCILYLGKGMSVGEDIGIK